MAEFDPNGLVKAMGPQRDPYSWAELYAADASKQQQLREELKNRLLIQEMTRSERAKEGELTRGSHERIAGQAEAGRNARWQDRVKGLVGPGAMKESRIQELPPGSISHEEYIAAKMANPRTAPDITGRRILSIGGKAWYLPPEGAASPAPAFKPRMVPDRRSKYDDTDDEE